MVLTTTVFGLAAMNVLVAQGAFRVQALAQQQDELRQQNGVLRLEVASLTAPNRIAKEAKQLGLVLPKSVEVVDGQGSRTLTGEIDTAHRVSRPAAPPKPAGTE